MNSTTKLTAKRLRSPAASSTSVPFDPLARTNQENTLFHELDHFFSEPAVARRALVVARAAKEELGGIDPVASGERLALTKQAFRCYQKSMRIILAEYPEHDGRTINIPADVLAHAARREHEAGKGEGQAGACMTAAYFLASESLESFVELMHRLDHCTADDGRGQTKRSPDPFRDGAREGPPPTGRGSSAVAGDRPSSRSARDPARKGAELFSKAKRETAQQPRNRGPSLPHRSSQIGTDGRRGDKDNPCRLGPSNSPAPPSSGGTDPVDPAAATSSSCPPSSRHEMPLVGPQSRRCKRAEDDDGCLTKDSRHWLELDDQMLPGEEAEGGGRNWLLHKQDQVALSRRVVAPPARPAVEGPVGGRSPELFSVGHDRGGARMVNPFQQDATGVFDGRRLQARGWFVETDSADWVNVPTKSTTGDFSGAGADQMDMSGTFGTDDAVASPHHLFDESKGDFTFDSSTKKSNYSLFASHDFVDNFHFSSSSKWNVEPYEDCKPYSGFSDGDDNINDEDDERSTGSEEFFPEPDPFDPADGGLPCLARAVI